MRIPRNLVDELIEHARSELPNECCGMIGGAGPEARTVYPAENIHASPLRYEIGPRDQIRIYDELDARGEELVAIYHSHTKSAAYPSQTDVNLAQWPECLYVIVSLAERDAPDVRAFSIVDEVIEEVPLDGG